MSIKSFLQEKHVLDHVILPGGIDALLSILSPVTDPHPEGGGVFTGEVILDVNQNKSPLPGFDFQLGLPTQEAGTIPFKLQLAPDPDGPTSFWFWLILSREDRLYAVFKPLEAIAGLALTGADFNEDPQTGEASLEPNGKTPLLVCRANASQLAPSLLIHGTSSEPAGLRFTPDTDPTEGVITAGLEPACVVFGASKIGFHCPSLIIDDSGINKGPGDGTPGLDPPLAQIDADRLPWRGILARQLDFYLPRDVPFFAGRPIRGYAAVPMGTGGVQLVVETKVPPKAAMGDASARPGYSIRIECIDPTARGLSGMIPTLISASMELPVAEQPVPLEDLGSIAFMAGKPVRATATFSRDPAQNSGKMRVAIGLSSQGPAGLASVKTDRNAGLLEPAKIFNVAAAMATSLIANGDIESEGGKYYLSAIAAGGAALSALFEPESQFVLHCAEIAASGHGLPAGEEIVLNLDYSVAVRVKSLQVPGGGLSVGMVPDQPMRIRVRRVTMKLDMRRSGLEMFDLDYNRAEMDIENPGAWKLDGFEEVFDVIGSRSGRGSAWVEVDLRFKLNLGPVKVSGVTIRGTLQGGQPVVSLTGMSAGLDLPGVVSGRGALHLVQGGFEAQLAASIIPIQFNADATVIYKNPMVFLKLDTELPAPLPLANSGLGLFGIGGMFGASARPNYANVNETDPVLRQLQWSPRTAADFLHDPGNLIFGISAVVGTLPDFGFTFASKAEIMITVPDVSVRAALNGTIMRPRMRLDEPSYPPVKGISFLGFFGVDSKAASFAVIGSIDLRPLLEIRVPVAGYYPVDEDTSNWYTYLGADGHKGQGREIGPISAKVLPGILNIGADAYLMARGKGIDRWPVAKPFIDLQEGFLIAFGFSLYNQFGIKPIAWAELYLGLDLLLVPEPLMFAGFGRASGGLHLGPFSLGVSAEAKFLASAEDTYLWVQVRGRIELFFFDIEGTVTLTFGGDKPEPFLPLADTHPLDRFEEVAVDGVTRRRRVGSTPVLTDDSYRVVGYLAEHPDQVTEATRVWPDILITLPFAFPTDVDSGANGHFDGIYGVGQSHAGKRIGSELLRYWWLLKSVRLVDVTNADNKWTEGTPVMEPPPGEKGLPARWQAPRGSASATELLLFSKSRDLWVNRRADNGEGVGDPIGTSADFCKLRPRARPAWAIGHAARRLASAYLIPQIPLDLSPLASRIEAKMRHYGVSIEDVETRIDRPHAVSGLHSLLPARVRSFDGTVDLGLDRSFEGAIMAPWLAKPRELSIYDLIELGLAFVQQRLHLDLVEPMTEGVLVLVGPRWIFEFGERFMFLKVEGADGQEWTRDRELIDLSETEVFVIYRQPEGEPVGRVLITWPIGASIGILGLRGMSSIASQVAQAQTDAIIALTDQLADAKAKGPKLFRLPLESNRRTVLEPGHLYRLDLDFEWFGERFEAGETMPAQKSYNQREYLPPGTTVPEGTLRQLFFGTTNRETRLVSGNAGFAHHIHKQQNVFVPEMIERYLAGYEPGQSEQFHFRNDPVAAHFTQSHVAALADAYKFKLMTAARRIDRPGNDHALPLFLLPTWTFGTNRNFLSGVDQYRFDATNASICEQPTPGATAKVDLTLDAEAWYEVYVSANVGEILKGRLPGVTFRTSRWRDPDDMLAALGFHPVQPETPLDGPVAGDIEITGPAPFAGPALLDDDMAFQDDLNILGLGGWPVAETPRQSRLWVGDGADGWLLLGFMLESPEPIHRAGRLEFGASALTVAGGPPGAGFKLHRRDRSGSRLLFAATAPFRLPVAPANCTLVLTSDRGHVGKAKLPAAPAFAEDP